MIGPDGKPIRKVNCIKILKRADTEIIKPLLIYNYESISHRKQKEFFDLMMKQGVNIEQAYAGGQINIESNSQIIDMIKGTKNDGVHAEILDNGGAPVPTSTASHQFEVQHNNSGSGL